MKHVLTFAIAVLSLTATQASAYGYELENVRALLPKPTADSHCPSGSLASYVPLSFQGATGQEICNADYTGPKTCTGIKFFGGLANNGFIRYAPRDLTSCNEAVNGAWPWGRVMDTPGIIAHEWSHGDTFVVCCQQ